MTAQTESNLQQHCVAWFRWQYPKLYRLLFSSTNGAMLAGDSCQRAMRWARLEKEGAVSGVADLFLSVPSGDLSGLYIEMKTPKGRQSEKQKAFERDVLEKGYGYAMPRTENEFQRIVKQYLKDGTY